MKAINLNKSNDLKKLQLELNSILESKIANAETTEAINAIDSMPFWKLKNIFESISDKLYNSKEGKKLIREYCNTIKENKDLQTIYTITDILSKSSANDSYLFLTESISLASNINKKNLSNGLKKYSSVIKECVKAVNLAKDEIINASEKNNDLFESIDYVLNHRKSTSNINLYTEHLSYINEHIKSNNNELIENELSPSELIEQLNSIINESDYCDAEKQALKEYTLCELSNGNKETLFEEYKKRCLDLLQNLLESSKVEESMDFSTMKSQLELKSYNEETIKEDILKLSKLESTLLNE